MIVFCFGKPKTYSHCGSTTIHFYHSSPTEALLVRSKWEKQAIAQEEQRPPRKYYELTKQGHEALAEAVKRYRVLEQPMVASEVEPKPSRS